MVEDQGAGGMAHYLQAFGKTCNLPCGGRPVCVCFAFAHGLTLLVTEAEKPDVTCCGLPSEGLASVRPGVADAADRLPPNSLLS